MAVSNPCCCCTVQTGTKVVAIVNIVFASLGLLLTVLGLFGVAVAGAAAYSSEERQKDPNSDKVLATAAIFFLVVAALTLICLVGYLVVCILLLIGANTRHYGKCRLWFIVTLVLFVLYSIRNLYETVTIGQDYGAGPAIGHFASLLVGAAITGWQLWTVYAFMDEIKNEGTPAGQAGYVHAKQNEDA